MEGGRAQAERLAAISGPANENGKATEKAKIPEEEIIRQSVEEPIMASSNEPEAPPIASPSKTRPAPAQDLRSPKRPRSPKTEDGDRNAKRARTDQSSAPEPDMAELDFNALLQNALGSFDEQFQRLDSRTADDSIEAQASTAQPSKSSAALEKIRENIVQPSTDSLNVMRSMSLPVLGNFAVQILLRLSLQPWKETEDLIAGNAEFATGFETLRRQVAVTRETFASAPCLLSADELNIREAEDRETIRIANLATTSSSIFFHHDLPLQDLHEHFLSVFIPEEGKAEDEMYKLSLTDLYVCVKTQAVLSELGGEGAPTMLDVLDRYFSDGEVEGLKQRRAHVVQDWFEESLASKMMERRVELTRVARVEGAKGALAEQYPCRTLQDDLGSFLNLHLRLLVDYAQKSDIPIPLKEGPTIDGSAADGAGNWGQDMSIEGGEVFARLKAEDEGDGYELGKHLEHQLATQNMAAEGAGTPVADVATDRRAADVFDAKDLTALIAENLQDETVATAAAADSGMKGVSNGGMAQSAIQQHTADGSPPQGGHFAPTPQSHPPYPGTARMANSSGRVAATSADGLPPSQTEPTQVLYDRARLAAVAKTSSRSSREGMHSTRRPWSPEEERALMTGLDLVKGPHWSQILVLFGANGTISDILKDRTQVQLKDKARNLKLFFLKTNSEMPYYLQSVTGELKTRAPTQAARKEAEEKARLDSEEKQTRLPGIETMVGGGPDIQRTGPKSAASLAAAPPRKSLYTGRAVAAGKTTSASAGASTAGRAPPVLAPAPHPGNHLAPIQPAPPRAVQPQPPAQAQNQQPSRHPAQYQAQQSQGAQAVKPIPPQQEDLQRGHPHAHPAPAHVPPAAPTSHSYQRPVQTQPQQLQQVRPEHATHGQQQMQQTQQHHPQAQPQRRLQPAQPQLQSQPQQSQTQAQPQPQGQPPPPQPQGQPSNQAHSHAAPSTSMPVYGPLSEPKADPVLPPLQPQTMPSQPPQSQATPVSQLPKASASIPLSVSNPISPPPPPPPPSHDRAAPASPSSPPQHGMPALPPNPQSSDQDLRRTQTLHAARSTSPPSESSSSATATAKASVSTV